MIFEWIALIWPPYGPASRHPEYTRQIQGCQLWRSGDSSSNMTRKEMARRSRGVRAGRVIQRNLRRKQNGEERSQNFTALTRSQPFTGVLDWLLVKSECPAVVLCFFSQTVYPGWRANSSPNAHESSSNTLCNLPSGLLNDLRAVGHCCGASSQRRERSMASIWARRRGSAWVGSVRFGGRR